MLKKRTLISASILVSCLILTSCLGMYGPKEKPPPEDLDAKIERALAMGDYSTARVALKGYPGFVKQVKKRLNSLPVLYYFGHRDWDRRQKHYKVVLAALPLLEGNARKALLQLDSISDNECVPYEKDWYRASAFASIGYFKTATDIALKSILRMSQKDDPYFYQWTRFFGYPVWLSDQAILDIYPRVKNKVPLTSAMLYLWGAKVMLRQNNPVKAAMLARQAREVAHDSKLVAGSLGGFQFLSGIFLQNPGRVVEFDAALIEGRCWIKANQPEKAIKVLAIARGLIGNRGQEHASVVELYAVRALAEALAKNQDAALRYCRATEKYIKEIQNNYRESRICLSLGRAYWSLDMKKKALEWLYKAIRSVEKIQATEMPLGILAEYYAHARDAYTTLVRMLIDTGDTNSAFLVSQRGRSRALFEKMTSHLRKIGFSPKYRELQKEAARLRKVLAFNSTGQERSITIKKKLKQIEDRMTQELALIFAPDSSNGLHLLKIDELQKQLKRGQVALVYQMLRKRSIAWAVGPDFSTHVFLPSEKEISKQCRLLHASVSDPRLALVGDRSWRGPAAWLYEKLIKPFKKQHELGDTWLVIPDGNLVGVPFEVFLDRQTNKLVNDIAQVVYLPSISVMKQLSVPSGGDTGKILIASISNLPRRYSNPAETAVRGFSLQRLPFVNVEAKEIYSLYGPKQSVWLREENASESNIKAKPLTDFGILHFACHAVMPSDVAWLSESALILGTSGPEDSEDGLLMASEVEGLDVHADLVVLSACETARGKFIKGTGFLGLSTSFIAAGAKRVLVSQWSVSDWSTSLLMKRFYEDMKSGNSPQKALQDAKIWLRHRKYEKGDVRGVRIGEGKARRTMDSGMVETHPFYWAPFVLVGDPAESRF